MNRVPYRWLISLTASSLILAGVGEGVSAQPVHQASSIVYTCTGWIQASTAGEVVANFPAVDAWIRKQPSTFRVCRPSATGRATGFHRVSDCVGIPSGTTFAITTELIWPGQISTCGLPQPGES